MSDHLLSTYEVALCAVLANQLGPRGHPGALDGLYELLQVSPKMADFMAVMYGLAEDEQVKHHGHTHDKGQWQLCGTHVLLHRESW